MRIQLLNTEHILHINQQVCSREKQASTCLDTGKVESALAAAFYPGSPPFQHGGVAAVAGALCYFLTKNHAFLDGNKRTAGIASAVFLDMNGYCLQYPIDEKNNYNAWASIIEKIACSTLSKDEMMGWYDQHKNIKT